MANYSAKSIAAGCLAPFLAEDLFTGGYVDGRLCSAMLGPSCCLPCPATEWFYPDGFSSMARAIEWINVGGIACSVFLLTSFAFLPAEKTHRHYLTVFLTVAVALQQMGFIIALAVKPEQCFNEITPHDMHTSHTCALSGTFILAGGWTTIMWVFLRSVELHLQICWQQVIGKAFILGTSVVGWGIPAIAVPIALVLSGVSFHFGDACYINYKASLADFWIPLLVVTGMTVLVQFFTFIYCTKVYLSSLPLLETGSSGPVPSYSDSFQGTLSPRQAWRRILRVVELQWRGIAIALLVIADIIFLAVIFVLSDYTNTSIKNNPEKAAGWLACLVEKSGKKDECLQYTKDLVMSEHTIIALLLLLSTNGYWSLVFHGRFSMFTGWYEMFYSRIKPNNDFVSADVVHVYKAPRAYKMLLWDRDSGDMSNKPKTLLVPITPIEPALQPSRAPTSDYSGREARYKTPTQCDDSPRSVL